MTTSEERYKIAEKAIELKTKDLSTPYSLIVEDYLQHWPEGGESEEACHKAGLKAARLGNRLNATRLNQQKFKDAITSAQNLLEEAKRQLAK